MNCSQSVSGDCSEDDNLMFHSYNISKPRFLLCLRTLGNFHPFPMQVDGTDKEVFHTDFKNWSVYLYMYVFKHLHTQPQVPSFFMYENICVTTCHKVN
jgi:hypothetical protein